MGRKEDMFFLARKRTKSIAEETGVSILESFHLQRVGLDSREACPTQGKFCHFVNPRSFVAVKDL